MNKYGNARTPFVRLRVSRFVDVSNTQTNGSDETKLPVARAPFGLSSNGRFEEVTACGAYAILPDEAGSVRVNNGVLNLSLSSNF